MKLNLCLASFALVACAGLAQAQVDVLVNSSFESGDPIQGDGFAEGWTHFGNAYREPGYCTGNTVPPLDGSFNIGTFGNFSGGFNVSGFFQDIPCVEGDLIIAKVNALVPSCDPVTEGGFSVWNLEFFDANNNQVGIVYGPLVANASSPLDVWTEFTATGNAPGNAVRARAVGLFFQYGFETGAVKWDLASVYKTCPGDVNRDGTVDFGDFLSFFNAFDTLCL